MPGRQSNNCPAPPLLLTLSYSMPIWNSKPIFCHEGHLSTPPSLSSYSRVDLIAPFSSFIPFFSTSWYFLAQKCSLKGCFFSVLLRSIKPYQNTCLPKLQTLSSRKSIFIANCLVYTGDHINNFALSNETVFEAVPIYCQVLPLVLYRGQCICRISRHLLPHLPSLQIHPSAINTPPLVEASE